MMKTDIDPDVVDWLKKNSLIDEFNDALLILKSVIPCACVESIKYSESITKNAVIICSISCDSSTDFIVKRNEFFRDIETRCFTVYKHIKVVRSGRFSEDTTVSLGNPNGHT